MSRQVRFSSPPPSSKTDVSSEYLGKSEQRTPSRDPREFDVTRVDRHAIRGGPMTQTYENLVKGLFRPEERSQMSNAALPPSFAPPNASSNGTAHTAQNYANQFRQMSLTGPSQPTFSHLGLLHTGTTQGVMTATGPRKVSAAAMLKVEQQLGKDALDDTNDEELWKSPLEAELEELIAKSGYGRTRPPSKNFSIYAPKTSSEYFTTMNTAPPTTSSLRSSSLGTYRLGGSLHTPIKSYKERSDELSKTNRQTLVDYKDFSSAPLSPYLYQSHPYVHSQDSRIVGSNFVQVTTRPKDRFLEKIEKTLEEVRSSPRYASYDK